MFNSVKKKRLMFTKKDVTSIILSLTGFGQALLKVVCEKCEQQFPLHFCL